MKIILQDSDKYVLRFDKDEEVFAGLAKFMKEQSVAACAFNGIGASSAFDLGYYNHHLKDYRKKPFVEDAEIVSLNGNGSLKDNEPIIHAHGMFGRTDFTVVGGHIFKLVASPTCEIFLTKLNGDMKRELNVETNLNLLA